MDQPYTALAVVTGAGSGIGRATAVALAERGLRVVGVGRRTGPLEETAGLLACEGRMVSADIGTADGVAAVAEAVGRCPVAAVVHAAAIEGVHPLADTDRNIFDRLVATNLAGPFFLTRALAGQLADGAGVVFVGSISALHGRDRHAAYSATKAGLLGLTTSLAVELAPRVRVNCVTPGGVDTPMLTDAISAYVGSMSAEDARQWGASQMSRQVLNRVATPAELAEPIVHLALDASYATGSVMTVDGGFSCT